MFNLLNNKTSPIGLDIGYSSIKMIQLARRNDDIRVVAAERTCFDPAVGTDKQLRGEFAVTAIKEMLSRGNFHGSNVVSCLGNDSLKIKSLRLDSGDTDQNQIEQLLRKEVAQQFGLDVDTDEIRYMIAGKVHQGDEIKNEVLFFGTSRENIEQHISLLEETNLTPVAIDVVPCALFRSFQRSMRRHEDKHQASVCVNLGSLVTTVIIGRGRQITFVKQIPIAGRNLTMDVASRLGISLNEAMILRSKLHNAPETIDTSTRQTLIDAMSEVIDQLAKEISLCFKYYAVTFRGKHPQEAVFAGDEAYETVLLDALKKHLAVKIKLAEPLRGFDLSGAKFVCDKRSTLCEWAVAVGLSIKRWNLDTYGSQIHERN